MIISAAGNVLNRYAEVIVTDAVVDMVTVSDITDFSDGGAGHYTNNALSAADMVLIHQAQGAAFMNTTNTPAWGEFSYVNARKYEFALVTGVASNTISVDTSVLPPFSCEGIGTYDTAGIVQVVRVPQYNDLTVNSSASILATDWNGVTGGIVALLVQGYATIKGSIDVTRQSFQGGAVHDNDSGLGGADYATTNATIGAVKGEGILGFAAEYAANGNGLYGRGAPANGGGGGFVTVDANSGSVTTSVAGANTGTTASASLTEFPANGGSAVYAGDASTAGFNWPGCNAPTAITLEKATAEQESLPTRAIVAGVLLLAVTSFAIIRRRSEKDMLHA